MSARDPEDRRRFGRAYGLSVFIHAIFLWMLFTWFVAQLAFGPQEPSERRVSAERTTTISLEARPRLAPAPRPRHSVKPHPRIPQPIATLAVTFPPTYRPTALPSQVPSPAPTAPPRALASRTSPPATPVPAATPEPTVAPQTPSPAPTVAPQTPSPAPTVAPQTPSPAPTIAPTIAATIAAAPSAQPTLPPLVMAPLTPAPTRAPATPQASRTPRAVPTVAATSAPARDTSALEARMRRMLASINDPRHYEMKDFATEIADAEKRLASDYEVLHLRPPPLHGIGVNTKAYEFDLGQVLYALRTIKVGPFEICAGWLVTTRGEEQPPAFYVGPCKKNETIADPRDRPRQPGFPTPPPLHN